MAQRRKERNAEKEGKESELSCNAVKEGKEPDQPDQKKARAHEEEGYATCTFHLGPDREVLEVDRAMLASKSEVLQKMLYGTGEIPVDPSAPIVWPEYSKAAMEAILHAWNNSISSSEKNMHSVPRAVYSEAKELASMFGPGHL